MVGEMSDEGVKPCPGCGTTDYCDDSDGKYWIHDTGCPLPMAEGEIASVAAACGLVKAEVRALLIELAEQFNERGLDANKAAVSINKVIEKMNDSK